MLCRRISRISILYKAIHQQSGINLSPSQLLMSRRLHSNLPMMSSLLSPQVNTNIQKQLEKRQQKQRQYYNRGTRSLLPLSPGDAVRYKTGSKWQPAIVISTHTIPRSYIIRATNGNIVRRNRRHLKRTVEVLPELNYSIDDDEEMAENLQESLVSSRGFEQTQPSQSSEVATERVSRYGRHIRVPERYKDTTQARSQGGAVGADAPPSQIKGPHFFKKGPLF